MQRFVLSQNIQRSRLLLTAESNESSRRLLSSMIHQWENDLALLNAEKWGAAAGPGPARMGVGGAVSVAAAARWADREFQKLPGACLLVDPGPGLRIIDLNDSYAAATCTEADRIAGDRLFQVFPDNPDDPTAEGVRKLYASLVQAVNTGMPQPMEVLRYDVRNAKGLFEERYWRPLNTPIFADDGRLLYILHQVQEVPGPDAAAAMAANDAPKA